MRVLDERVEAQAMVARMKTSLTIRAVQTTNHGKPDEKVEKSEFRDCGSRLNCAYKLTASKPRHTRIHENTQRKKQSRRWNKERTLGEIHSGYHS